MLVARAEERRMRRGDAAETERRQKRFGEQCGASRPSNEDEEEKVVGCKENVR